MQQALLIILGIIFGFYLLLILYYLKCWLSIPNYKLQITNHKPQNKISVIIAARNEAENITACLEAITKQSYPSALFEVIVVDDHSTDNTAAIIKSYADKNVKFLSLKDHISAGLNSYKKKAIEIAIQHATGELIVTTDADCWMSEHWLQTIAAFYEEQQPVFIAAPVAIKAVNGFIEFFQALDFMTLQGITGASVHKKIHSMCNGANMAYTKKAFEEVGGFTGIDNIASGDDMLLMHKIYKRYPDKVMFLKSREVIVQTAPVKTIGEFFRQRIRWASKAKSYDDKRVFLVLLLVYLVNLSLLLMPIFALFTNLEFSILNFQFSLLGMTVCLFFLKTVVELAFLYPVANFFDEWWLLTPFILVQPVHIIYTVVAGGLGTFGSYTWKGRSVK